MLFTFGGGRKEKCNYFGIKLIKSAEIFRIK